MGVYMKSCIDKHGSLLTVLFVKRSNIVDIVFVSDGFRTEASHCDEVIVIIITCTQPFYI